MFTSSTADGSGRFRASCWLAVAWLLVLAGCGATGESEVAVDPGAGGLVAEAERRFATRSREDLIEAFDLYRRAGELDPELARAHAGMATVGCLLALYSIEAPADVLPVAELAAQEALRLDPQLAEAVAALGLVDYLYHWDFERAEARFGEASALDPGLATADHWRGMLLMATGRFEAAVQAYDAALAKDPSSTLYRTKRAVILAHTGRRDEAVAELTAIAAESESYALVWRETGFLALEEGRIEDAVIAFERAADLSGGASKSTGGLGYAWARSGRQDEARQVLAGFVERSEHEWVPPMYLAMMYGGLGASDQAFAELRRAVEARDPGVVYLAVKAGFVELRPDPRFDALLREVGLK